MPFAYETGCQRLLDLAGQSKQAHGIGNSRPTLANTLSDLLLSQSELVHQLSVGTGFFQRV